MVLIAIGLIAVLILLTIGVLLYRLSLRVDRDACDPAWLESFSLDHFAPMERLLDSSDLRFLESQPGYRPALKAQLIRERRKALLGYIRLLTRDFNQLIAIAKLMLVYSNEEHSEFGVALWRQQLAFHVAVWSLRGRLVLRPFGGHAADGRNLLDALGRLRQQIDLMSLQQAGAA